MKVFLDTNVWLSAVLFPGLCSELIVRCAEEDIVLLSSVLVHEEALAVLARKFPQRSDTKALFDASWQEAGCVADCAQPEGDNDARLVAAAARADADLFITGDARVLEWKAQGGMKIVSPREAWGILFVHE